MPCNSFARLRPRASPARDRRSRAGPPRMRQSEPPSAPFRSVEACPGVEQPKPPPEKPRTLSPTQAAWLLVSPPRGVEGRGAGGAGANAPGLDRE